MVSRRLGLLSFQKESCNEEESTLVFGVFLAGWWLDSAGAGAAGKECRWSGNECGRGCGDFYHCKQHARRSCASRVNCAGRRKVSQRAEHDAPRLGRSLPTKQCPINT